jgi:RND superfamily putative drug exporter
VSGSNAAFTDIGNRIFSHAPWFLLYIIGITFLLLAMAFRSAVIALKAALTTLLSALVGFGVLTLVVPEGLRHGLIGLDRTGPIESFVPPIAFAILFGLSMDYEVFLMSRIREEHVHGEDTVEAVKDGVAGVGRVIVAAALIMSSVFFSFLLSPDRVSKEFGLLLGVAILTDALADAVDARAGAAHAAARPLVGDPGLARARAAERHDRGPGRARVARHLQRRHGVGKRRLR